MEGFAEKGTPPDWDIALGKVRGFRTWSMRLDLRATAGSLRAASHRTLLTGWGRSMAYFDTPVIPELYGSHIEGMYGGHWYRGLCNDGWYDARCTNFCNPPDPCCGCGFWAYWTAKYSNSYYFGGQKPWIKKLKECRYEILVPLSGVIEGSGPTIIGEKGFRTARARITDLAIPGYEEGCTYEESSGQIYMDDISLNGNPFSYLSMPVHRFEIPLPAFLSRELQVPEHLVTETVCTAVELILGKDFRWHDSPQHLIKACPPDENYGG